MRAAILHRESFAAMGTRCALGVTASFVDAGLAQRALAAGRAEVEACERALSRFDPESDLSRLNASAGRWTPVDERLVEALDAALRAREQTGGRFDPTILPALVAAGYDRSFELLAQRPPRALGEWRGAALIEVDREAGRARVEPGASVDLGGIGKGFSAERALTAMRSAWPELPGALVDLGGDVAVRGATPEGGPWRIEVEDPRRAGTSLGTLLLGSEGGVATSGPGRRRFGPGRRLHHLIDPVSGVPAGGGPPGVTVVAAGAAEAEAHATALAITAPADAHSYLDERPWLAAVLVRDEGEPVTIGPLRFVALRELEGVTS
jgi:thiamine biosynthesis lipoprotein